MAQLFFNNARAVLNVGIDTLATSITLTDVVGLPASLASGDWFLLTIYKDSRRHGEDHEVVRVTATSDDGGVLVCTVERGVEMAAVPHVVGEPVEARMTAGVAQEVSQRVETLALGTPDWPVSLSYDSSGNLSEALYEKGDVRLRQSLAYDTSGNLSTVLYEKSGDSGTTYNEIGFESLTYDTDGNLTQTQWLEGA